MKMPAPTMPPITSMVESNRPSRLASGWDGESPAASADCCVTGFDSEAGEQHLRDKPEQQRSGQREPGGLQPKLEDGSDGIGDRTRGQAGCPTQNYGEHRGIDGGHGSAAPAP